MRTHTHKSELQLCEWTEEPCCCLWCCQSSNQGEGGHTSGGKFFGTSCKDSSGKERKGRSACPELCWVKAFPVCETGVNKEKDQLIWEVPPASRKAPIPHSTECKPCVLGWMQRKCFLLCAERGRNTCVWIMLNTLLLWLCLQGSAGAFRTLQCQANIEDLPQDYFLGQWLGSIQYLCIPKSTPQTAGGTGTIHRDTDHIWSWEREQ